MAAKKTKAEVAPTPYVTIYESELQVIAGESALRDSLETGGDLFGAQTRAGRPLIYLATGPGPKAAHAAEKFTQDIAFFQQANQVAEDSYGLQWQGTWHSHHKLGMPEPSLGDTRQVGTLARKNGFSQWLEIIATHDGPSVSRRGYRRYWRSDRGQQDSVRIRANAFVYTNPQDGQKVPAPIRVLPGISPFRLVLLATGRLDRRALGEHAVCFPTERIVYDALGAWAPALGGAGEIPEAMNEQIRELPDEARRKLDLCLNEELLVVTFQLPSGWVADVGLGAAAPHAVKAVRLRDLLTGRSSDLTKEIGEWKLERLGAIYKALADVDPLGISSGGMSGSGAATAKSDSASGPNGTKVDLLR